MKQDFPRDSGMIMTFNYQTVIWITDTIPMKDKSTGLYHHKSPSLSFICEQMNHKHSEMNIISLPRLLMVSVSLKA
jgi:hypothetical protein